MRKTKDKRSVGKKIKEETKRWGDLKQMIQNRVRRKVFAVDIGSQRE